MQFAYAPGYSSLKTVCLQICNWDATALDRGFRIGFDIARYWENVVNKCDVILYK